MSFTDLPNLISHTGLDITATWTEARHWIATLGNRFGHWRMFAIGALVVFAYMLLLAAPALLGAFNDDIEDVTGSQQNE